MISYVGFFIIFNLNEFLNGFFVMVSARYYYNNVVLLLMKIFIKFVIHFSKFLNLSYLH